MVQLVIIDQNNGLTVSLFLNILFLVSGVVLVKLVSLLSRFWSCVLYVIVACVYIYCCNCSTKRVHILIIKILSWAVDGYHISGDEGGIWLDYEGVVGGGGEGSKG